MSAQENNVGGQQPGFYDALWAAQWRNVARHSPLRSMRERLMLAELRGRLRPGVKLLDVGSGDGHFLSLVRERFPRVEVRGVDFSAAARDNAPAELQALISVGDVSNLRSVFPTERFDVIVCSEVLEHVEEPARVIAGIAALLAPGGRCVLTVPGGKRYWSALDESAGHLRRFEFDEVPELLTGARLRVIKHYAWGAAFGRAYYKLVRSLGPGRAASSAGSPLGAAAGMALSLLLRVDDYIPTRKGFQIVSVADA